MQDNKQRDRTREPETTEATIDNERMGRNALQGDDQKNVRNERRSQPDERGQADDIDESFDKLDKDKRARADLNKGARRD
ncbi:MAG: hypothetical protein KL840_08080 [Aquamicrobium sp.]|nr:hypothetical protein [Aquamicrobium sp.]